MVYAIMTTVRERKMPLAAEVRRATVKKALPETNSQINSLTN